MMNGEILMIYLYYNYIKSYSPYDNVEATRLIQIC